MITYWLLNADMEFEVFSAAAPCGSDCNCYFYKNSVLTVSEFPYTPWVREGENLLW